MTPSEPLSPEQIAKLESEWEQDPAFKAWLAQQSTSWRDDATGTA